MLLNVLKGKIHRATVTQAELDYIGSITIDSELMEAAGIQEYELVTISDCNNGNRLETYVIAGEPGSGVICLNGAAAHLVTVGDKVIIMNYCQIDSRRVRRSGACTSRGIRRRQQQDQPSYPLRKARQAGRLEVSTPLFSRKQNGHPHGCPFFINRSEICSLLFSKENARNKAIIAANRLQNHFVHQRHAPQAITINCSSG